jgi:Protein of unknown function (DUF559)
MSQDIVALWPDCESPIERAMLSSFAHLAHRGWCDIDFRGRTEPPGNITVHYRGLSIVVLLQPVMGPFRTDFLVVAIGNNQSLCGIFKDPIRPVQVRLVVECDGQDFHRDKFKDFSRDQQLLRKYAHYVLRFTGSEIWRDAQACARHVLKTAAHHLWPIEEEYDFHMGRAEDGESLGLEPVGQIMGRVLTDYYQRYLDTDNGGES